MTDINDVPQVNALYNEQQQVQSAIYYLDNGGSLTTVTVSPPPPPDPSAPAPGPGPITPYSMMTVQILLKLPNSPDMIAAAQDALNQRNAEIMQELADLGVTGMRKER